MWPARRFSLRWGRCGQVFGLGKERGLGLLSWREGGVLGVPGAFTLRTRGQGVIDFPSDLLAFHDLSSFDRELTCALSESPRRLCGQTRGIHGFIPLSVFPKYRESLNVSSPNPATWPMRPSAASASATGTAWWVPGPVAPQPVRVRRWAQETGCSGRSPSRPARISG